MTIQNNSLKENIDTSQSASPEQKLSKQEIIAAFLKANTDEDLGELRAQGRLPKDDCLTEDYTDGIVLLRRAIFRKLKKLVKKHYAELCNNARNNIHYFDKSNIKLFDEIISIKCRYKNNVQKMKMQSSSSDSSN